MVLGSHAFVGLFAASYLYEMSSMFCLFGKGIEVSFEYVQVVRRYSDCVSNIALRQGSLVRSLSGSTPLSTTLSIGLRCS